MFIIGIAGGSGSGKSTFVRQTLAQLPNKPAVSIIPQDNYYYDCSHLTEAEKKQVNFDHPDSIEFDLLVDHLNDLRLGIAIQMPQYVHKTCTRLTETTTVNPTPIVIVEGLMCFLDDQLRRQLDLKLFIDVDDDLRLIRCIQRDMDERGRNAKQVIDRYLDTVKPMHRQYVEAGKQHADLIVLRGGENKAAQQLLLSFIQHNLQTNKV